MAGDDSRHHVQRRMNAQEPLRKAIDEQRFRLLASIPPDREASIIALLGLRDRLPRSPDIEPVPDLITGRRRVDPGGNLALWLCLESSGKLPGAVMPGDDWDAWAARFLDQCGQLAEAELVLAHCESGFMRIVDDGPGTFGAWIASKRVPTSWREHADFSWWAAWIASRHASELRALQQPTARAAVLAGQDRDALFRRVADLHLEMMAYQLGYPPDAVMGGCTVQTYLDVLRWMIRSVLQERAGGTTPAQRDERALILDISTDLALDPATVERAIADFTLDPDNAAYHAAVPGVAAAPLVRVGPGRIVGSLYGLMTEPLLFLTRELRRRDAQGYHNSAYLRETVFRTDLYALFPDKRFVTSAGRIVLRRDEGNVRTDIDAAIFDRKTGTLGIFELKSQDPFARSTAELTRQRDNVLFANRQIGGVLDWLKRHGADELLNRIDRRTAKSFRVHKVYPFVLGRYLAHFSDGPEPDRRAAWGTWPQVLRLIDGQAFRSNDANPLASLFARLAKDLPLVQAPTIGPPRVIAIGDARLTVHPSYSAYKEYPR